MSSSRLLGVLVCLGILGRAGVVTADDRPPFRQQVAAARKAKIGCKDLSLNTRYAGEEGATLIAACKRHRWPLEWIVCEIDEYGRCERHLKPAQRRQLTAAKIPPILLGGPAGRSAGDFTSLSDLPGPSTSTHAPPARPSPKAPPVRSKRATVDQIAITRGHLDDGGAGAARWAHRTLEGCLDARRLRAQTARIRIDVSGDPHSDAKLAVRPDELRSCLQRRLSQLVWTDDVVDVTLTMRVTVR